MYIPFLSVLMSINIFIRLSSFITLQKCIKKKGKEKKEMCNYSTDVPTNASEPHPTYQKVNGKICVRGKKNSFICLPINSLYINYYILHKMFFI